MDSRDPGNCPRPRRHSSSSRVYERALTDEFFRTEFAKKMVSVHLHESWVAHGGSMKKQNNVGDNLLSVWSILVKFAIFYLQMYLSGTRTQILATEEEDISAPVIFLGIFLGNGRVF